MHPPFFTPAAPSIAPYDAVVIAGLLQEVGLPAEAADRVTIVGDERPFATPFAVVEAAASVLGAIGAAASLLWNARGGAAQEVTIRRGHAGASLVGFAFQGVEGGETPVAPWSLDRPLVKLYQCRDERWIHLHGEFAHLGAITCDVLGCAVDSPTEVVADRVARWDAPGARGRACRRRHVRRHGALCERMVGASPSARHCASGTGQHREDRGQPARTSTFFCR